MTNSMAVIPSDQRSALAPYPPCKITSGAYVGTVPDKLLRISIKQIPTSSCPELTMNNGVPTNVFFMLLALLN